MKKIKIDREKCIGCGLCAVIAEKAFRLDEKGKAEVFNIDEEDEEKVKEAIDSCPVGAIEEIKTSD